MRKTILSFFLSLSLLFSYGQSLSEKIVAALDSFSFIRPQEKTYLQTDRITYMAGETVWLKVYATLFDKPTILSKVAYIEMINEEGVLLEKKMLKLIDGTANASMEINNALPTGNYYLRCYTLWMLNFPDFIKEKKISVLNNSKVSKNIPKVIPPIVNVSFFPEGGNLISGVKSNIAFKAFDQGGNPVSITGNIINSKNEKITSLVTLHDGMGAFELQPDIKEIYKAEIQYGNGKTKIISLPVILKEGAVLTADNSNPGKTFVKAERGEFNKEKYNNLLVVAQLNYQVVYMGKLNIDEGQDAMAINKKTLPPGIMQITLLTENGEPIAERMVFVATHTISSDLLKEVSIDLQKRKKNTFSIDINGYKDINVAISITSSENNLLSNSPTILSGLLMSADIKGKVFNPGYYFKDKNAETLQKLDLVMMTNGWRRYKLEEIMDNKFSVLHYPFETGLSITGKVLQSDGKTPLKSGRINLMIKGEDSTNIMSQAATNPASAFIVDNIEFKKSATVYYQGTNTYKTDGLVAVTINPSYFDTLKNPATGFEKTTHVDSMTSQQQLVDLLESKLKLDSAIGKTLQNVVVKSKKRSITDSLNLLYASDIFFDSDQTLALNENINYYDIWQFLQGMVPGIKINKTDTGTQVNFSRYEGLDFFSENAQASGVQFFLNEIPVSVDIIDFLNPDDVGLIKVYKGATAIALGASRGAIAIYTIKGRSVKDWRSKGFEFFKKEGYAVNKEFFVMDYSKLNPQSSFTDIRPTLYWNPSLSLTDGKKIIEFYNDDVCKKFRVVIEGIDTNGKLFFAEKIFQ